MYKWLKRFKRSEKGQGMVEYGLILALVSVVAIGSLVGIGGNVTDAFDKVVSAVSGGEVIPEDPKVEEIDDLIENEGNIPISTPEELNYLRDSKEQTFGQGTKWENTYTSGLDKKYILVSDLDLSGIANFEPIGTNGNRFNGTFNGWRYTINNLSIDKSSSDHVGLFGCAEGATFKNIRLEDVSVTGHNQVGGLIGYQNTSKVTSSHVTGIVQGSSSVGGLVGYQETSSTITSSYARGVVTCTGSSVGGLVGYQFRSSTITDSYSTSEVTGDSSVGGLVGFQSVLSEITDSYATGAVAGGDYVGGLVGSQYSSSTETSYYDTETTGQTNSDGGTGKTTVEMGNKDTYTGWDFESIWTIKSNQYPTHR